MKDWERDSKLILDTTSLRLLLHVTEERERERERDEYVCVCVLSMDILK